MIFENIFLEIEIHRIVYSFFPRAVTHTEFKPMLQMTNIFSFCLKFLKCWKSTLNAHISVLFSQNSHSFMGERISRQFSKVLMHHQYDINLKFRSLFNLKFKKFLDNTY